MSKFISFCFRLSAIASVACALISNSVAQTGFSESRDLGLDHDLFGVVAGVCVIQSAESYVKLDLQKDYGLRDSDAPTNCRRSHTPSDGQILRLYGTALQDRAAWAYVIGALPGVTSAWVYQPPRAGTELASVNEMTEIRLPKLPEISVRPKAQRVSGGSDSISLRPLRDQIRIFFLQHFDSDAKVSFVPNGELDQVVQITNLRGKVTSRPTWWEKLNIEVAYKMNVRDGDEWANIYFMHVEGFYATGAEGAREPSDRAYKSISDSELQKYAKQTIDRLKTFLEGDNAGN